MRSVLITGKNSFLGSWVEHRLAEFGEQYRVSTLDMRDSGWTDADFTGYDSVLHVAGIAHVTANPNLTPLYEAVNRDLAIQTAQKAKESGVTQFILMSSMIVYGEASPVGLPCVIGPDTPPNPANAYGKSKLDAETGILALADDSFRVAVLRPPMIYGPGCKGNYTALEEYATHFQIFPDFANHRSALYVENYAEFVRQLIDSGVGGMFFPRNREVVSTTDFMRGIASAWGKRMRFTRLFNPLMRLLGRHPAMRRAFGDICYGPNMPDWPGNYQICGFAESVRRTQTRTRAGR